MGQHDLDGYPLKIQNGCLVLEGEGHDPMLEGLLDADLDDAKRIYFGIVIPNCGIITHERN